MPRQRHFCQTRVLRQECLVFAHGSPVHCPTVPRIPRDPLPRSDPSALPRPLRFRSWLARFGFLRLPGLHRRSTNLLMLRRVLSLSPLCCGSFSERSFGWLRACLSLGVGAPLWCPSSRSFHHPRFAAASCLRLRTSNLPLNPCPSYPCPYPCPCV